MEIQVIGINGLKTGIIEDEEELEEYLLAKKIMRNQDVWISEASILGPSISEEKDCQDVMVQMIRSQYGANSYGYIRRSWL